MEPDQVAFQIGRFFFRNKQGALEQIAAFVPRASRQEIEEALSFLTRKNLVRYNEKTKLYEA
jgi:hypothetical protein